MPDVSIDYSAMEASKTAYANMRTSLDAATSALGSVSASAVPQQELRRRLEDLHDSWGGGIDKLGHAYSSYVGVRLLTPLLEALGNEPATAQQLARLLLRAGALRVDVYCLARTPAPGDD